MCGQYTAGCSVRLLTVLAPDGRDPLPLPLRTAWTRWTSARIFSATAANYAVITH